MKTLVTGGAGFIGSNLVEKLVQLGHQVIVVDNLSTGRLSNLKNVKKKIKFINIDLSSCSEKSLNRYFKNVDWVFHLAGLADIVPSITEPQKYFNTNVIGTLNVLKSCRKLNIKKFIYAASASCYGIPKKYPTNEKSKIDPQYPYALTKRLGEEVVMHWSQVYNLPAISLRLFNVYGPRSRTSGTYGAVFGVFLAQKLANKPFTVVGDGKQTRDFTYVSDVVSAFIRSAQSDHIGEILNVGSGNTYSVNRLIELLGGDVVHIPHRPGEPECTFADIKKITEKLDWLPSVSLEEGVNNMLENIEYWRKAPVWTPDSISQATKAWFENLDNR